MTASSACCSRVAATPMLRSSLTGRRALLIQTTGEPEPAFGVVLIHVWMAHAGFRFWEVPPYASLHAHLCHPLHLQRGVGVLVHQPGRLRPRLRLHAILPAGKCCWRLCADKLQHLRLRLRLYCTVQRRTAAAAVAALRSTGDAAPQQDTLLIYLRRLSRTQGSRSRR